MLDWKGEGRRSNKPSPSRREDGVPSQTLLGSGSWAKGVSKIETSYRGVFVSWVLDSSVGTASMM